MIIFFFSSRRRHTRCGRDWSSDVCSSDLFDNDTWWETLRLRVLALFSAPKKLPAPGLGRFDAQKASGMYFRRSCFHPRQNNFYTTIYGFAALLGTRRFEILLKA